MEGNLRRMTSSKRRSHHHRGRRHGKRTEVYYSDATTSPTPTYESGEYEPNSGKSPYPSSPTSINQIDADAAASSFINIAPLPIFRGIPSQSAVVHLSRFSKVCTANNLSNSNETAMRIFPSTLDDDAILWYDSNIEPYPSMQWEEVKASFLEEYSEYRRGEESKWELRSELMMIKQRRDESVKSYFMRLQSILRRWPAEGEGVSEELVRGIFVDGIREDLKRGVVVEEEEEEEGGRMRTLEGAVAMALEWEKGGGRCGFCGCNHGEKECIIRKRMKELWLRSRQRQMAKVVVERKSDSTATSKLTR